MLRLLVPLTCALLQMVQPSTSQSATLSLSLVTASAEPFIENGDSVGYCPVAALARSNLTNHLAVEGSNGVWAKPAVFSGSTS